MVVAVIVWLAQDRSDRAFGRVGLHADLTVGVEVVEERCFGKASLDRFKGLHGRVRELERTGGGRPQAVGQGRNEGRIPLDEPPVEVGEA